MTDSKAKDVLEALKPEEAQDVLRRLLDRRPDLRTEVDRVVNDLFGDLSFEKVAAGVERALRATTVDQMRDGAGQHAGGYTEPKEAALHLMEEAVQPFLDDLLRRRALGRDAEAQEICEGIMLGLYELRGKMQSHDVLQWCPDFPSGHAWWVFNVWSEETTQGRGRQRTVTRQRWLPREFVRKFIPEWDGMAEPEEAKR